MSDQKVTDLLQLELTLNDSWTFLDDRCVRDNSSAEKSSRPEDLFTHVTYGYVIPLMCVCGLVGNVLNLAVLTMQRFNATMYLYLRWMAVADILAMLFWMPQVVYLGWSRDIKYTSVHATRYYTHVGFPLINIFTAASTLLVVGVTLERYMSVCHPLTIKFRQTVCRARVIITICFVLPAVLDLPVMLGKHVEVIDCVESGDHYQVFDVIKAPYKRTEGYRIGYNWLRITMVILGPLVIITILNAITLYTFRHRASYLLVKQSSSKDKMNGKNNGGGGNKHLEPPAAIRRSTTAGAAQQQEKEEMRLTTLLCAIIVLFMITMFPYSLFQILHYTVFRHHQPPSYVIFRNLTNLLMVVNSSLHFYLYCLAGKYFRRYFLVRFGCLSESVLMGNNATRSTRSMGDMSSPRNGRHARGTSPRSSCGSITIPIPMNALNDTNKTPKIAAV